MGVTFKICSHVDILIKATTCSDIKKWAGASDNLTKLNYLLHASISNQSLRLIKYVLTMTWNRQSTTN